MKGRFRPAALSCGRRLVIMRGCPLFFRVGLAAVVAAGGCSSTAKEFSPGEYPEIRRRAMACLKAAIGYDANPAVRVQAVEALESSPSDDAQLWIRSALLDQEPAVRFAACVALGRLGDGLAERRLRVCVRDEDGSVQAAALFALHHLGYQEGTGHIPTLLLHHQDATVRRNAALVLGLLGEPGAIKVLARAMRDADPGVRQHALEAMARLGSREARQELTFMANAGVGSEEVFAISALAETVDPVYRDTFLYKLNTAPHLETRLAAARGLGRLGSDEGFSVAREAVRGRVQLRKDPGDPAAGQMLRVRQMAAAALGAIGRSDALPELVESMNDPTDPRVQVSAARAALEILTAPQPVAVPASTGKRVP